MPQDEAGEILDKTLAKYRGLSSYRDEGFVQTSVSGEQARYTTTFDTLFASPGLFRFQFKSPHPHPPLAHLVATTICGFDGRAAYMWTNNYGGGKAKVEVFDQLALALAGATGISSGAAHTIGKLLLPELSANGFQTLRDLAVASEEKVGGRDCVEVRGKMAHADIDVSLFIDREALLVRKVTSHFGDVTIQEHRENIVIDAPLEPSRFERPAGES